jgi:endonuclease YncB( thermonuclease family)
MKYLKILLFFLIIVFFFNLGYIITILQAPNNVIKVKESRELANVTRIIDGDTIELQNGQHCRLLGINTPEKNKLYYQEAKLFLSLIENKSIILIKTNEDKDKYNRSLRYLEYNNSLINEEILKNGLATLYYYKYDSYYNKLKLAEQEAREKNINLWEKSKNFCKDCIILVELNNIDPGEYIILKNNCNYTCNLNNWTIKDDANHLKKLDFTLKEKEKITINYNGSIWNDDKDSLYLRDEKELLVLFYRYG